MPKQKESYQIIAIHDSSDEVEQIINHLRNHGIAARATVINELSELSEALKTDTWDLILSQLEAEGLSIKDAVEQVQKLDKDIPIIGLSTTISQQQIMEMMQSGVAQVLPAEDTIYFPYVIGRELSHLQKRRQLRKAEIRLHDAEKRSCLLLESSRDAIAYVADGMHILANQAYVELFGYHDPEEIAGLPVMDMVAETCSDLFRDALKNYQMPTRDKSDIAVTCLRADGARFNVTMNFTSATYEGEPCIQILIHKEAAMDHTQLEEKAQLQEKLKQMSMQDLTTGLYNRRHFEQEVSQAIDLAVNKNMGFSIFYIHLDGFNKIRAKIGVEGIDLVIQDMAQLLRKAAPPETILARFGEDAYAILWQEPDPNKISEFGELLRQSVEQHLFEIHSQTIQLTTSIGIAVFNETAENAKQALSRALQACTQVQENDGNGVQIYMKQEASTSEETQAAAQASTVQELQKAIDHNLFKILFQPIINLRGSSTEFYEVLLRRVNEDGSLESPEEFLKTAQAAKVATIVDRWVILQAVKTLIARRMNGYATRIIINLTSQSLKDKTFLPWLAVALKATKLPPESVTFQVNEQDTITHLKRVQQLAEELKKLHCNLSISRFGATENPMAVIKHVALDFVKLDGQFTLDIQQKEVQEKLNELVRQIHQENIKTIAPLVESAGVLSVLWQVGVYYIQGYYLQPPMESMNYDFNQDES